MIRNSDLPNSQRFSNAVDWDKAKEFVKDTLNTLNTNAGKKEEIVKPAPVAETKILGMHPMTLMITTFGVLIIGITGVILYNKYKS